ncbi:MAG: endonuclease [Paludibacter sp.]|nr:endonuclease [Paludibacter sp.]
MRNLLLTCLLFTTITSSSQNPEKKHFTIISYNLENFFDCVDDSIKKDEEYLPGGIKGWNYEKYRLKQEHIAKVITSIGGWDAPAIVGLYEVESEKCMKDLTYGSGLKNLYYKYIHFESPDIRGIDVALLYQPHRFKPAESKAINVNFPFAPSTKTRDILYVKGFIPSADTLHIFACHFPSRLGGELESEEKRIFVAGIVKDKTDSILGQNPKANIVIMGDFNDYPTDKSLLEVLQALPPENDFIGNKLYNLMFPLHKAGKGTHKINGEWGALDQIIVSGNLLNPGNKIFTLKTDVRIFDNSFLLVDDDKFLGKKPFRTYNGMKYQAGYSDHLPVYCEFWY